MVSMREVYAEIDEVKMIMVITNLVENAVKYNRDHGKVRVTLNADPYNFYISVEDTGVGIPQDSLDKIYERFYRVDKSRSREVGGTGLGLSITKSIVLQHHGAIDVQSILGEGTKFTVTCPLTYVSHPVELRRQAERLGRSGRGRGSRSTAAGKRSAAGASLKSSAPSKSTTSAKRGSSSKSGAPAKKKSSTQAAGRSGSGAPVKKAPENGAAAKKRTANGTAAKKKTGSGTAVKKKTANDTAAKKTATNKRAAASGAGSSTEKKTAGNTGIEK